MAGEPPVLTPFRFGPFELFAESGELRKDGVRLKLSGQPIQVLISLAAAPGKLVTREELQHQLWPASSYGDFEKGLNAAVNRLRENLHDSAHDPKYIETIPGRGYRFIHPVEPMEKQPPDTTSPAVQPKAGNHRRIWIALSSLAVVLLAFSLWWRFQRPATAPSGPTAQTAIAVLPFQNAGSDKDIDFLRLALPDEIATSLSRVKSFSVRPFATTNKYNGPDVDLQQAGRAMGVKSIVTGHYLSEAGHLDITLEAVDVATNLTIWRDQLRVASADSLAMRDQLISTVRQGLVPALGGAVNHNEAGTLPENKVAYDLYLHSLAMPRDAAPNKDAIVVLEHAVQLDPNYAPAWEALGLRYYDDAQFADGGEVMFKRSNSALERALALDPNLIVAASKLITTRTERGELLDSYAEALALVNRFPDSSLAHFTLSYVLRYGGLLDESAGECDKALTLDANDSRLRSCALLFMWLAQPQKAMKFLQLDRGTEWEAGVIPEVLLSEGEVAQARQRVDNMPAAVVFGRDFLQACLNPDQTQRLNTAVKEFESATMTAPDSELRYENGRQLAYCGQKDAALRVITSAVAKNFCAYEALQRDPLLTKLRDSPEFRPLLSAAKACQDDFLAKRQGRP